MTSRSRQAFCPSPRPGDGSAHVQRCVRISGMLFCHCHEPSGNVTWEPLCVRHIPAAVEDSSIQIFSPPPCGRVTMKYLAVLNSTLPLKSYSGPCVGLLLLHAIPRTMSCVMSLLSLANPRDVAHRRRPIPANIDSAERFMLLKKCRKLDAWQKNKKKQKNKTQSGLECFSPQIMCFDKIKYSCYALLTTWLHNAINANRRHCV